MPAKSADGGAKKTVKKATKKTVKKANAAAKATTKKTATKKSATATKKKPAKVAKSKASPAAPKAAKRAPKRRAAETDTPVKVRVRQVRSGIGRRRDFRQTLRALGIKHHQDEIVVTRNSAIDGMLNKVRHLVRVTPEE